MKSRVGSGHFIELILLVMMVTSMSMVALQSCSPPQVIPAKKIDGVWVTPSPVTFYNKIDSCGSYQRYTSMPVTLSLNISFLSDNLVDVLVSPAVGSATRIDTTCIVSDTIVFPAVLRGIVNSTDFVMEKTVVQYDSTGAPTGILFVEVATFTFTDQNTLTGTYTDKTCTKFCMGYETDPDLCILTRKN